MASPDGVALNTLLKVTCLVRGVSFKPQLCRAPHMNPCMTLLSHTPPPQLSVIVQTENFERAGHIKAAACASVSFLAGHPIGAKV